MMAFILLGDWVNESEEPDKVSLMRLGSNQTGVNHNTKNKDQLRMHFQQMLGKELSKENIETLITCKFSSIDSYPDLEQ